MKYPPDDALRLAQDPHTPPQTLATLAWKNTPEILKALLKNPNTPTTTLLHYGHNFPEALSQNPVLPMLLLEEPGFIKDMHRDLALSLLQSPSLPEALLSALLHHKDSDVVVRAVCHPNFPEPFLQKIARGEEGPLKNALTERKALSREVLEALALSPSAPLRIFVARYRKTPPALLRSLAEDPEEQVRHAVRYRLSPPEQHTPKLPALRYAARSETGEVRAHNEDRVFAGHFGTRALFVAADGMGGHSSGGIASQLVIDVVPQHAGPHPDKGFALLSEIFFAMHRAIRETLNEKPEYRGMGSTAAVLLLEGESAYLAHVGVDRVYRLREGRLERLTEDHSLVNLMLREGQLSPEDVDAFPHKNVIVKSLGFPGLSCLPDFRGEEVLAKDTFLVCTDGITGELPEESIEAILLAHPGDPESALTALLDAAAKAGGRDNMTAVVVEISALNP